jgi:hypothetical protein
MGLAMLEETIRPARTTSLEKSIFNGFIDLRGYFG